MVSIDLNCDMGEGMSNDAELMAFISSTNIACGYHAGDEDTMKRTVDLALQNHVAIGAHPGFSDREHFGRRELNLNEAEFYHLIIDQIFLLKKITDSFQAKIHHVKPHGAMYNMAARNEFLARSIAQAVKDVDPDLILYGLSGSHLISEAESLELKTASEVFADRTYQDDGTLTPRSQPNALIEDENKCIEQVLQMIRQESITSVNKQVVQIVAQTICIHGDGTHPIEFASLIRHTLKKIRLTLKRSRTSSAILGAAFLMATSAIGPGFLTQTTVFTQQLAASFAFVILISILLDIGAQLNMWRIITMSEMRAQELANKLLPGLGFFLAALVALGGLAFNIGNIAGCGLGVNVLLGTSPAYGAVISCVIALIIFWMKDAGKALDLFAKILGIIMILLTLYVAISSHPPVAEALKRSIFPEKISMTAIITLVGGTVGGYISFAGAHRLLDAGIKGRDQLPQVNRSTVSGIIITGTMRIILFLAVLGVVAHGFILDASNPPASVFKIAAGEVGYYFFGVVMWSASITSVVGASYTSVSFLKSFHPFIERNQRWVISFFIVFSTIIFVVVGKPVQILVAVGAMNGLILPVALASMLVASSKSKFFQDYKHPIWLQIAGWIVVIAMTWLSVDAIRDWLPAGIFNPG